jgi:S-adenosylmethionine synthetase
MARYVAKNVVAAGLCTKCEVQVSYAIGFPQPTSILVDSFGTGKIPDEKIAERVKSVFNFSPGAIEKLLKLRDKGRTYLDTAAYGHFGRDGETFTWEKTDKAEALK